MGPRLPSRQNPVTPLLTGRCCPSWAGGRQRDVARAERAASFGTRPTSRRRRRTPFGRLFAQMSE